MIDRPFSLPQQQEFAPAPERGPLALRVDRIVPAAPDGEAWNAAVEALAERMAADGPLYPSALHVAAEGMGEPPQGPGTWGSLFARLRAQGWQRVYMPRTSRVASRNAASEPFAWLRPEARA